MAVHLSELMELQHKRQIRGREKQRGSLRGSTLAKTLKTVRHLSTTLHTAEQFRELSYGLQRELYDHSNGRLYAFLIRPLGEDYSQMIPAEEAGGPRHSDGLQCWRITTLKHSERSASSEAAEFHARTF